MAKLVIDRTKHGLHKQFDAVAAKKKYNPNDVAASRAYVGAYVEYVHYVERLYNAAGSPGNGTRQEVPGAAKPAHVHWGRTRAGRQAAWRWSCCLPPLSKGVTALLACHRHSP